MANTLNKNGITTGNTVEAYHVTQSIDAFTGAVEYDISLSGSLNVTGSLTSTSFTGSLLGTASNAQTASFVTLAQTASYVEIAQTASYIVTAQTASFVTLAQTASYVENAQTASFVLNAISSSFATTASFATNAVSASYAPDTTFPYTGSALITGSLGVTGSISTSGSNGTINGVFFNRGGGNVSSNISIGATTNFSSSATGGHNFAAGTSALPKNTIGTHNTAIGYRASFNNTTGSFNTAIGVNALFCNTSGSHNIAFGQNAGFFLSGSSSNNIAIGFGSGPSTNTEESNKLYIASGSGVPLIKGDFAAKTVNISGSLAVTGSINNLLISTGGGNVSSNISIGATTNFSSSATGTHNFAAGSGSLSKNTSGTNNTAIGYRTLCNNTEGCNNTAIGFGALYSNTTGCHNTAIGNGALASNTEGNYNTAIGNGALFNNPSGSNNIAFGQNAGKFLSGSSSNNVAIGFGSGPSTNTEESNKLYIASGSGTPLIKGDFAAKTVNISGSLTATSFTGSLYGSLNPRAVGVSVANGTTITGPGSTTPKISTQITIPANTLSTNCILEMVWMSIRLSGTGGIIQSAVYLSTSAGTLGSDYTVGAVLLATGANMASTIKICKVVRDLNKQGTAGLVANAATQYPHDFNIQDTITSFTIDNSSTLYLQFCISSTGISDTSCIRNIRITEYK
jgi:trimeric autotransporter adhesin